MHLLCVREWMSMSAIVCGYDCVFVYALKQYYCIVVLFYNPVFNMEILIIGAGLFLYSNKILLYYTHNLFS